MTMMHSAIGSIMAETTTIEMKVSQYLTELDAAPSTIKRKLAAVRAFARFQGVHDFMRGYAAEPVPRAIPHPLPEGMEGIEKLLLACRTDEHRALVALCGLCGLRISEAITVQSDSFAIDGTEIDLTVYGKGRKTRVVPVAPEAWANIAPCWYRAKDLEDSRIVPLSDKGARLAVTRLGMRAFGRPVPSHDLRSTFATATYYNSGQDIIVTQELLGHANVDTTRGYTRPDDRRLREAVDFRK
jgi:integrase/recombinase XerD